MDWKSDMMVALVILLCVGLLAWLVEMRVAELGGAL